MQTPSRTLGFWPLVLTLSSVACGVGGIGQTTTSPVQPSQTTQQQASTTTGGNTTGAVDPGAATTGGTGSATTTADPGATTTPGDTTAGTTAGPTTGTTTGATTSGDGNTTTQNGNANLFDLTSLNQAICYYDTAKGTFALTLSNDAQFCAHAQAGIRMAQDHDLAITADLTKQSASTTANMNNTNDTNQTLAQPKNVAATLALYSSSCALQSQATSLTGSVTLNQADATSCTGSFTLTMEQTMPTLGALPTTLNGTFANATGCTTLTATTNRKTCQ